MLLPDEPHVLLSEPYAVPRSLVATDLQPNQSVPLVKRSKVCESRTFETSELSLKLPAGRLFL